MPFARKIITDYETEWDSVVKFRNQKEYVKTYNYYKRHKDFKDSFQLVFKLKKQILETRFASFIKAKLIDKWMEFECPNRQNGLNA